MLAIDLQNIVAEVVVRCLIAVSANEIGFVPGRPFLGLHDHPGIRQLGVAAAMVEMKMRYNDGFDLTGVVFHHAEARRDVFAGMKCHVQPPRHLAEIACLVRENVAMQAGVEQDRTLGMIDQVAGYRHQ